MSKTQLVAAVNWQANQNAKSSKVKFHPEVDYIKLNKEVGEANWTTSTVEAYWSGNSHKEKGKGKGKGGPRTFTKKELAQRKADRSNAPRSGEGQSPGEALGHNSHKKGKSKGKGSPKGGKGKGKAKGKSKENWTKPDGKGKGKGTPKGKGKGKTGWQKGEKGKGGGSSKGKGKGKSKGRNPW